MDALRAMLEQQPILALFLVIALGYALGALNIRGFSLGVGAVLFVGLAFGAFSPKSVIPDLVQSIGLVLFLYGIGIQYGRQFVDGLRGSTGRRMNIVALISLVLGASILLVEVALGLAPTYAAGLFAGALTSTATLQAALDAAGTNEPSIGYGVAYPLGVIVPILSFYIAQMLFHPRIPEPERRTLQMLELSIQQTNGDGDTLGEVMQRLPPDIQVAAVRQDGVDLLPQPEIVLNVGDEVLVVGSPAAVARAREMFAGFVEHEIVADARQDYLRVFVSKASVVGRTIANLRLPEQLGATVVNVRRGDAELYPRPNLILDYGDRVGVITRPERFDQVRAFFGGSIKGTTEFSYVSLGLGMVMGVILGLIKVPIPGIGTLSLGLAGGPLLVALVLGYIGRSGPLTWTMPVSANLTLRTFGLTLFLAAVGINSGNSFVTTVAQSGLTLLGAGALITFAVTFTALVLGARVFRLPFDEVLGLASAVTGNPAIIAYAAKSAPTEKPDIGYAIIFPGATILKIVFVQVFLSLFRGGS